MAAAASDQPLWTITAAAIPALVTLLGTVWQIYARRPPSAAPARADGAAGHGGVRVLQVVTHAPASTVHPWFARAMVVWHLVVATGLILIWLRPFDVLPFARLGFLIPMAGLYLLGALFYAVKYRRTRDADLGARAELVVEAESAPLFERCRAALTYARARVTAFDCLDPTQGRAEARVGGAVLAVSVTRLDQRDGLWRYRVRVEASATRRVDGIPAAGRCAESFLAGFLA